MMTNAEYQQAYRDRLKDNGVAKLSLAVPQHIKQAIDVFAAQHNEKKGVVWNNIIEAGAKAYGIQIKDD